MAQPRPKDLLEAFADKYGLRFVESDRRYLGLYKGICIDAGEYDGSVYLYFFSPTAYFPPDAILDKAKTFSHLGQTKVPPEWMDWRTVGNSSLDWQGCLLELSPERMLALSEDDLLAIPAAIADDLHDHGAVLEAPHCSLCRAAAATRLLYANDIYRFACDTCFDKLRDSAPDGVVNYDVPIRWAHAVVALLFGCAAFAFLWGLIQQPADGVDGRVVLIAPLFGSVFVCRFVAGAARGMNSWLRSLTVLCVIAAILAGNVWGFRTAVMRQVPISWIDAIRLYFTAVLPAGDGNVGWFLIGGLGGCWIGFSFLKRVNTVRYR